MSQGTPDLGTLLETLVEQQTALLQVHGESVRLQRILLERLVGGGSAPRLIDERQSAELVSGSGLAAAAAAVERGAAVPPAQPTVAPTEMPEQAPIAPAPARAETPPRSPDAEQAGSPAISGTAAARYYQAPAGRPARPVSRQELDLLHELHDLGDVASLVLQFGPHKGSTLAQVARTDPEYLRQLVRGAQRPEVRAAAQRLVTVLDAVEHQPRGLRARGRRNGR